MYAEARSWPPVEILLVEDNPADVALTEEALEQTHVPNRLHVVSDGTDALEFLHKRGPHADAPRPDIIFLDLNLPGKDGRRLLGEIKGDAALAEIPVVVLTTSQDEGDILQAYRLHANCYIPKPVDFGQFLRIMSTIGEFWLGVARLPKASG